MFLLEFGFTSLGAGKLQAVKVGSASPECTLMAF